MRKRKILKVDARGEERGCHHKKTKGIMELVHSDICVPMPSTSLRGYAYYAYFIDAYSHKNWVYLLKSKDEVLGKFK